jgi:DNA adenine methylase
MTTKNYYLFAEYAENEIFRSPLFYVGDKYKLIKEIKQYFPRNIDNFIEPFVGGGTVFMNIKANKYLLNDIDFYVYKLHQFLNEQANNPKDFFKKIEEKIMDYGLSYSFKKDIVPQELKEKYKKTYYAHFNRQSFQRLKDDFNKYDRNNMFLLYLLLIYGFNRMLRFNSDGNYNLPVGNVDFNKNVIDALNNYFYKSKNNNIEFYNLDYKEFLDNLTISKNDLLYFDPPYLITFSEYNKYWNEEKEKEFVDFLSDIHNKGFKFAVSNVIHYKNKENYIFSEWSKNYKTIPIKSNYISYHDNTVKNFKEVLVINYEENT